MIRRETMNESLARVSPVISLQIISCIFEGKLQSIERCSPLGSHFVRLKKRNVFEVLLCYVGETEKML